MYPTHPNPAMSLRIMSIIAILLSGSGGLMALTNPNPQDFNQYATETLQQYLKNDLCMQVAEQLNGAISSYCKTVVDAGRPQIANVLDHSTIRYNYLFFSIYVTTLQLPAPIPQYQFETLGILDQFYIFEQQAI
jgi:uncharacterized protein YceK